jgi:hypothetical protein
LPLHFLDPTLGQFPVLRLQGAPKNCLPPFLMRA